jgi:hypothetical protein
MENVKKVQNAFSVLYSALEKSNKAGVFNLSESSAILTNTQVLREYLQTSLNQVVANLPSNQQNTLAPIPEATDESNDSE